MSKSIYLTILLTLALGSAASAQEVGRRCSNTTGVGTWGFTTAGVILGATGSVPVTAVGSFTEDVLGNINGSQVRSLGGGTAHETFSGTVRVTANCTAEYTIHVYDATGNLARTSVLDGVLTNSGTKARVMFESIVLPDGTSLPSALSIEGDKL